MERREREEFGVNGKSLNNLRGAVGRSSMHRRIRSNTHTNTFETNFYFELSLLLSGNFISDLLLLLECQPNLST